ncbi:MAG: SDR family oxidoreductase [Parvibaculaceae bacterium]
MNLSTLFSQGALKGRRAVVTGATAGIGKSIARELARAGASVVITGRDEQLLQVAAGELNVDGFAFDVADAEAVAACAEKVGHIDILVNNAGIDQHGYFLHTDESEWRRLVDVNLFGTLYMVRSFLPGMHKRGFGRIINIASEAGRKGSRGGSVYAATKGGVIAFTKSIAQESARYGVTANVVCPGPIKTPLLEKAVSEGGKKLLDAMTASTLFGRLGSPEEVSGLVTYLATDNAAFITGEVIGVSGGMGL